MEMLRQKDIEILHHLRNNSRQSLTSIAKKMNIPITTVYDRVLANEKKYVRRHTSLLDFQNLGLPTKMLINLKVPKNFVADFESHIKNNFNINSAYKTDFDGNYIIELLSENTQKANGIIKEMKNKFSIKKIQIHNIIEELQKEAILTEQEHIALFSKIH